MIGNLNCTNTLPPQTSTPWYPQQWPPQALKPTAIPATMTTIIHQPLSAADVERIAERVVELLDQRKRSRKKEKP